MAPPNSTSPEAGSSPEPSAEISSDMKTSPKKKSSNKALKSPAKRTAKTPARATAKGTDTVKSPVKPMPAWSDEDFKLLWNVLQSTGASPNMVVLANRLGVKKGAAQMRWARLRTKAAAAIPEPTIKESDDDNKGEEEQHNDE